MVRGLSSCSNVGQQGYLSCRLLRAACESSTRKLASWLTEQQITNGLHAGWPRAPSLVQAMRNGWAVLSTLIANARKHQGVRWQNRTNGSEADTRPMSW